MIKIYILKYSSLLIDKKLLEFYNLFIKEFIVRLQYILMKGEMLYVIYCKGDYCVKLNIGENVILRDALFFLSVVFSQLIITFYHIWTIKDKLII